MSIRHDHKGKYFTEVKRKEPIRARIQAAGKELIGTIHVQPDLRLLDELNMGADFIPITDAEIHSPDGVLQSSFIALNRNQIDWIIPLEEDTQEG